MDTQKMTSDHGLAEIAAWLAGEGLGAGRMEVVSYPDLASRPQACVIVGSGPDATGRTVGFAAETAPGHGVVDAMILHDDLLIQGHGLAAAIARETGQSLLDILRQVARAC